MQRIRSTFFVFTVVLALLGAATATAEYSESFTFDGDRLAVGNLIGAFEIEGHDGSSFEVTVTVRGRDAEPGSVRFESGGDRLAILFPLDRYTDYVYPDGPGNTSMSLRSSDGSWFRALINEMTGRRIDVRRSGRGQEIWADVTIRVPAGTRLEVEHGVGRIEATDVEAGMSLDTASGPVTARRVTGDLNVDTGSGEVEVETVTGDLSIDTGSGRVRIRDVEATRVSIDTGSGSVDATDVIASRFDVDTGSGGVTAERIDADSALIDTGSGSVELSLAGMGSGDFEVDTGSGSILLEVPPSASAEVTADTGSGGIDLDVPASRVVAKQRDYMKVVLGDGAARVRLDTGSGSIRVRESG